MSGTVGVRRGRRRRPGLCGAPISAVAVAPIDDGATSMPPAADYAPGLV